MLLQIDISSTKYLCTKEKVMNGSKIFLPKVDIHLLYNLSVTKGSGRVRKNLLSAPATSVKFSFN